MIDGVGKGGTGRIDIARQDKGAVASPVRTDGPRSHEGAVRSELLELVSGRAPFDTAKVDSVRAAIRDGRYPIDANRIAASMLDFDIPRRG